MAFGGFSKQGDRFFHELAIRQDRDWFKAHKSEYESLWVTPMSALLGDLRPGLARAFKGLKLAPEKYFRLQRDVRFSKDKSPYKTFAAAMIRIDAGQGADMMEGGAAALYLHLGTEDTIALGHWMFTPPELAQYRELLLDPKRGAAIARKLDALRKKGFVVTAFESLKRVPKGVDPSHPLAALLKLKGLGLELPPIPKNLRYSPKLAGWMLQQIQLAAPLVSELEHARRSWNE